MSKHYMQMGNAGVGAVFSVIKRIPKKVWLMIAGAFFLLMALAVWAMIALASWLWGHAQTGLSQAPKVLNDLQTQVVAQTEVLLPKAKETAEQLKLNAQAKLDQLRNMPVPSVDAQLQSATEQLKQTQAQLDAAISKLNAVKSMPQAEASALPAERIELPAERPLQ